MPIIDRWLQESFGDGSTTFAAPAQAAKIGLARIWHSKQILGTETALWKILVNGKDYPIYYGNNKCSKPPIRRGLVIPNFLLQRKMKQWSKISALGFGEMGLHGKWSCTLCFKLHEDGSNQKSYLLRLTADWSSGQNPCTHAKTMLVSRDFYSMT